MLDLTHAVSVCSRCSNVIFRNPESCSTGYGEDEHAQHVCFACFALQDTDIMIAKGRITLYLTDEGITNWPGSLRFQVYQKSTSKYGGGFGSPRTDAWFTGPDGKRWHAIQRGDWNQVARCRRTKSQ